MGRAHEVRAAAMAKTAAKKATTNGRIAKEIYLTAKKGGINPESNLSLRGLLEKAKSQQVPNDVVQRAIKRASGGEEINYIAGRYEALGPGGSALIIDVLTTNVNRASATIREVLNKNHGNPEAKVSFLFHPASLFIFQRQGDFLNSNDIIETLLVNEINIVDVLENENTIKIEASFKDFDAVKSGLDRLGVKEYLKIETTMLVNDNPLKLDPQVKMEFQNLVDKLDELEDVQNIYHNVI